MESPSSSHSSESKRGEKANTRSRRETISDRRRRVLGTTFLRYAQGNQKSTSEEAEPNNKRRRQVLQAQRAHRQRTLDYIDELEAEILRLKNSASTLKETVGPQRSPPTPEQAGQIVNNVNNINTNALIQSSNSQIASGIFATNSNSESSSIFIDRLPLVRTPWPSSDSTLPRSLEIHDPLTRMLFSNFSENIAPTLVAIDGIANGYRSLLLPLAWSDDVVRYCLLAASANQLRFQHPKLTSLAMEFQSIAIEKLAAVSQTEKVAIDTHGSVLSSIVLLIITDMMNGGHQFDMLFSMARLWVEAMNKAGVSKGNARSATEEFLLDQLDIIQLYAEPLLKEQYTIIAQHAGISANSEESHFRDNIVRIFKSQEEAIKQACNIYSYHVLNNEPPQNVEERIDQLKLTTDYIPPYAPGENNLAWAYFIAAAESCVHSKRQLFAKRLMGIIERGTFSNTTSAFVMLHHIWNCQATGGKWTKTLTESISMLVLK